LVITNQKLEKRLRGRIAAYHSVCPASASWVDGVLPCLKPGEAKRFLDPTPS